MNSQINPYQCSGSGTYHHHCTTIDVNSECVGRRRRPDKKFIIGLIELDFHTKQPITVTK
jgi:hypothetical protein